MGFLVKAATVAHADPNADIYCVDTKQVSFEYLRDIPGIYVWSNPQSRDKMRSLLRLSGIGGPLYRAP